MASQRYRSWLRLRRLALVLSCLGLLGLYGTAIAAQAISVRRARQLLRAVDKLKLGDSEQSARDALAFCQPREFADGFGCHLVSGPFNHPEFWEGFAKILGPFFNAVMHELQWVGVRPWLIDATVVVRDGKIIELAADATVEGQYEMLMARCVRQPALVPQSENGRMISDEDRRTIIRWWGGSGETLVVVLTPMSTEKERLAAKINPDCFSGFGGCSAMCEFLPGTTPVLDDRGRGYGGCTGCVPEAKCRPKAGPVCR